jgi:hypothetical protein
MAAHSLEPHVARDVSNGSVTPTWGEAQAKRTDPRSRSTHAVQHHAFPFLCLQAKANVHKVLPTDISEEPSVLT